ncbi:MAG: DUF1772 domain-containing protein [Actinomycetota bacterium]|jgi:uncharacterized membrane protein|nr:DUF1772 domain-containing protein [Rubrobacteraceae bacterium]MDQ3182156.1 DUF1772 domain-containing protein [Actinomycetota bacterium]
MDGFLFALTLFTALGCGVVAGVFFAFSAFVMKALARLPAPQGIAAMQAINVAAVTPVFMTVLLGTALACGALIVSSLLVWGEPLAAYLLSGGAFYLVGAIGPTGAYHVPRNEALATVEPRGADAEDHWSRYLRGWTAWNHLRFAAALAASATLVIALLIG